MPVAIRGATPATASTTSSTVSVTLSGARQPQTGDLLLIIHGNDYYTLAAMPTPTVGGSTTGVNPVNNGTADGGSTFAHAKAYTKAIAAGGSDLTVSVTETGPADEEKLLAVYVLSGVDTSTPIDTAAAGFDSTQSPATANNICPSVSPSTSDAYLICHANDGGGASSGAVVSNPSGMTGSYDTTFGGMSYCGATQQLAASGATGTKTFLKTNAGRFYATLTIALKTAPATPGETPVPGSLSGSAASVALAGRAGTAVLAGRTAASSLHSSIGP